MNSIFRGIRKSQDSWPLLVFLASVLFAGLTACGGDPSAIKERDYDRGKAGRVDAAQGLGGQNRDTGTLFGPGGLLGSKGEKKDAPDSGVAVNAFLWRASLDTINFIPL